MPESFDLVHARNVLMHVDDPDRVIAKLLPLLRPGGVLLLEEADYFPLAGVTSQAFGEVARSLVGKWTWARTMPTTLARLGAVDVKATIDTPFLRGGSTEAAFWTHTFRTAEQRLTDPAVAAVSGTTAVSKPVFDKALALLSDESFWTPFAAVVCVSCRQPQKRSADMRDERPES